MTIHSRPQGRPCRGGNEVGKVRIIESLREMLRTFPGDQVSRKRLAEFAGVTPALITYYFPEKDGLITEAALPVMEAHADTLRAILTADDDPLVLLRKAIKYLLKCYSRDAGIVWVYRTLMKEGSGQIPDYLAVMSDDLECFMKDHQFETDVWPSRALLLQGALWGIVELERNEGVAPIIDVFVGALQTQTTSYCGIV